MAWVIGILILIVVVLLGNLLMLGRGPANRTKNETRRRH